MKRNETMKRIPANERGWSSPDHPPGQAKSFGHLGSFSKDFDPPGQTSPCPSSKASRGGCPDFSHCRNFIAAA
jgi:hypothetical protein